MYRSTESDFCMLSIDNKDHKLAISCSDMAPVLKDAIRHKSDALLREKGIRRCWCCSGDKAIRANRMISCIIETMLAHGWALTGALQMTRSATDACAFLFTTAPSSPSTHVACISLADGNRIRLLDFPPAVGAKIRDAFVQDYTRGITRESQIINGQGIEMDMNESERRAGTSDALQATSAALSMLKVANRCGWRVVACTESGAGPRNVNAWYLVNSTEMPENDRNDQLGNENNVAMNEKVIDSKKKQKSTGL
eukprot:GEMP01024293.1.p2 GENE.GEMP01024293.1~~GEMP01024293.1.p2  ORF type:complete len:253 (+),score=60.51 GEMP01024293.1:841-1599(+)